MTITPPNSIKGVVFDVDGTLYHQVPMRICMTAALIVGHLFQPWQFPATVQVLRAYRRAQETLRGQDHTDQNEPSDQHQLDLTIRHSGQPPAQVQQIVSQWMHRHPLRYIRLCRRRGLVKTLQRLRQLGLALGVFSDYPVNDKLAALGIQSHIDVRVWAGHSQVRGFKPHSNGFQIAAQMMQLSPQHILYVGDRWEVDAVGAHAAGMQTAIIGDPSPQSARALTDTYHVRTLSDLEMICTRRHSQSH